MAALTGLIAHGGIVGAIAEGLVAVAVGGVLLAVWIRERRNGEERDREGPAELGEEAELSELDGAPRTPHREEPPR